MVVTRSRLCLALNTSTTVPTPPPPSLPQGEQQGHVGVNFSSLSATPASQQRARQKRGADGLVVDAESEKSARFRGKRLKTDVRNAGIGSTGKEVEVEERVMTVDKGKGKVGELMDSTQGFFPLAEFEEEADHMASTSVDPIRSSVRMEMKKRARDGSLNGEGSAEGTVIEKNPDIVAQRLPMEVGELVRSTAKKLKRPPSSAEATKLRFLEIARRRASHFAHFREDGEGSNADDTELAPGLVAERKTESAAELMAETSRQPRAAAEHEDWPGPFSTARRLVENRAAAAAAREQSSRMTGVKCDALINWTPSRSQDFQKERMPKSLHDMCIDILCANVDHVDSLEGVPESIKNKICMQLSARRKITSATLPLFWADSPSEILIPDCSTLSEEVLTQRLTQSSVKSLQVLHLGMCGRCVADQNITATIASAPNSLPSLTTLSLKGAYRLTDQGLTTLFKAAPRLSSLDLSQCSLLTEAGIRAAAEILGPNLMECSLTNCSQLECVVLLPSLLKMTNLKKLSLSGISGVTDSIVTDLSVALGPNLEDLNLADCRLLTDVGVGAVAVCCPHLRALDLSQIPLLSDVSLHHIADGCQSLRKLHLNRGNFSDAALAALVMSSGTCMSDLSFNGVRQAGNLTLLALAKHSKATLERLDMSWCRLLTDEALGLVADSCIKLRELFLFGCTQVTSKFLGGHSNCVLKVTT